jgi:hypothetical protein
LTFEPVCFEPLRFDPSHFDPLGFKLLEALHDIEGRQR